MDFFITSCKNSAGARWLTDFKNNLWTIIPFSKQINLSKGGVSFRSDSNDIGICLSESFRLENNHSDHSSTESINTIVEQYKSKHKIYFEANSAETAATYSEAQVHTNLCSATQTGNQSFSISPMKGTTDSVAKVSDLQAISETSFSYETTEHAIRKGSVMSVPLRKPIKHPSTFSLCESLPSFSGQVPGSPGLYQNSPKKVFLLQRQRRRSNLFGTQPCIKLSLQYFRNGDQLRIILLNTNNMTVSERTVYARCSLYRKNKKIKCITQNILSEDLRKINEEMLFDNIHFQSDLNWKLTVKLYSKKNFFSFKKCIGKANLPLSDVDLRMNKTFYCLLRPGKSPISVVSNEGEDFHIVSNDESIRAKAKASLTASPIGLFAINNESSSQFTWKPSYRLRRVNTDPNRRNRRR